ncbi:MAG: hypothetical protein DELT_02632 [Desulfovibrio sp.]
MASFLFSWGKKQDAAGADCPPDAEEQTTEGGGTPPVEPQEAGTAITAGSGGVSGAPVSPLAFDAIGGEVEVTYESMNNKKQKHFTQIFVNHKCMPTVTMDGKPPNPDYKKIKHKLVNDAYHALLPYVDFVMSLKGMEDRDDLRRGIEVILKRFIQRYWDMPASADSHHA